METEIEEYNENEKLIGDTQSRFQLGKENMSEADE